jgi:hypothetical protein
MQLYHKIKISVGLFLVLFGRESADKFVGALRLKNIVQQ